MEREKFEGTYTIKDVRRKTRGYVDDAVPVGFHITATFEFYEVSWELQYDMPRGFRVPQVGESVAFAVMPEKGNESYMAAVPWPFGDGSDDTPGFDIKAGPSSDV